MFTLCDGAYNYNGKLTIVGTVDYIKVPKVPTVGSIGLAVKLVNDVPQVGKKLITINFKDSSGENMAPEITFDAEIKDKIVIAGNLNGLNIKDIGDCRVELKVCDQTFILPFKVTK